MLSTEGPRHARARLGLGKPASFPQRPSPPSPILPLTPTTKRPCQSVHHMYPYSCPSCAPGQHARSSIIEFWGCTCSLVRPVTASHVSLPRIPSLHFLVLTGFQIPSCLSSSIKRPEHRSFWCLFASWKDAMHYCSCSATDPNLIYFCTSAFPICPCPHDCANLEFLRSRLPYSIGLSAFLLAPISNQAMLLTEK